MQRPPLRALSLAVGACLALFLVQWGMQALGELAVWPLYQAMGSTVALPALQLLITGVPTAAIAFACARGLRRLAFGASRADVVLPTVWVVVWFACWLVLFAALAGANFEGWNLLLVARPRALFAPACCALGLHLGARGVEGRACA
jgi:hypothetical protein